jgi:hypothetical protein
MKLKLSEATKPCGSLQVEGTGQSRVELSEIKLSRAVSMPNDYTCMKLTLAYSIGTQKVSMTLH